MKQKKSLKKIFKKKNNQILGVIIVVSLFFLIGLVALIIRANREDVSALEVVQEETEIVTEQIADITENVLYPTEQENFIPPPPPDMKRMKKQGCIADGLLNGYSSGTNKAIKMINQSECYYLHRAIETWLQAPDFEDIKKNMGKIEKEKVVYGMFIAEAISTKEDQFAFFHDRDFKFSKMCRKGSENFWGEHTCKPSFKRSEYRRYLRHLTQEAMDLGVQSFMFGQIFYQDDMDDPIIPEIIEEMRAYADFKKMEIVIGAQTNDITDKEYLQNFDFIEGGVGLRADKRIEEGPCFSRWWNPQDGGWCWALLWHEKYLSKANNVFIHLDWSGKEGDDMSNFTRMSQDERKEVLKNFYKYFEKRDIGFLMPMLTPLPKENGGCYGPKKRLYSADERYSCQDEKVINEIMK